MYRCRGKDAAGGPRRAIDAAFIRVQDLPVISIIVPVHNAATYVAQCIEALEAQDYPRDLYEIVMVDNGSTDASVACICGAGGSIRLLHEPKPGPYAARNRGVRISHGTIIAFTDADCAPHRHWLRGIARHLSRPGVDVVIGRSLYGNGNSKSLRLLEAYEHARSMYVLESRINTLYYGHTNNMAVRRHLLDRFPFLERKRGADTIFVRRVVDACSPSVVRYCPDMLVRHLEIGAVPTVYRKYFTYGRSRKLYRGIARTRPLTMRERLRVFRESARSESCSWLDSVRFLALLSLGVLFWNAGSLSALLLRRE